MSIVSVCGVALLCVCATAAVRAIKPDMAVFVGAAGAVVILGAAAEAICEIVGFASETAEGGGFSDYLGTVLKALGVTLLAQMTADICRDCGENAIASRVEFCAKCAIILLSLPVIRNIISLSSEILG